MLNVFFASALFFAAAAPQQQSQPQQPVALAPAAAHHPVPFIVAPVRPAVDVSRGSPPLAINPPLRI